MPLSGLCWGLLARGPVNLCGKLRARWVRGHWVFRRHVGFSCFFGCLPKRMQQHRVKWDDWKRKHEKEFRCNFIGNFVCFSSDFLRIGPFRFLAFSLGSCSQMDFLLYRLSFMMAAYEQQMVFSRWPCLVICHSSCAFTSEHLLRYRCSFEGRSGEVGDHVRPRRVVFFEVLSFKPVFNSNL